MSPQKTLLRDTRAVKAVDTTGTAETPPVASKTLAPASLRCRDTETPVTLDDAPDFQFVHLQIQLLLVRLNICT